MTEYERILRWNSVDLTPLDLPKLSRKELEELVLRLQAEVEKYKKFYNE